MHFGISLPPFGDFAEINFLAEIASEAETLGWDGFFLWDHMVFSPTFHPIADPWVALAVIADRTSNIRIGPMITPLARRRPWVLARQTVSIDRLSNGRLTLGVGLGDPEQWDFGSFGEPTDNKLRAQKLDEGLEILKGLWTGQPFRYEGQQQHIDEVTFLPIPAQDRIPIWVAGVWPNKRPMRRAAHYDGYFPLKWENGGMTPDDWREALANIQQHRTLETPFEAIHSVREQGEQAQAAAPTLEAYAEAGVTWWIEEISPWRFGANDEAPWKAQDTRHMLELIRRGPPQQ